MNGITPYGIVSMLTFVQESLLISFSVRFDLSSFYSRFTSKQCNVCLYFQLTTHIHIQLAVARLEIVTLKQLKKQQYPKPRCETFLDYLIPSPSFMFLTNVFTKKADTSFSLSFCGKCIVANFSIFERFKIKTPLNDECLSMYIINTIPHGKCFVRYLRTRCFCMRNLTRSLRSLVRFLIRQHTVRQHFP